jgi:hypothetical protein
MATVLPTPQPTPIFRTKVYRDVVRDEMDAVPNALRMSRDCPVTCEVFMVPQQIATQCFTDKLSRKGNGLLQNQPERYVRTPLTPSHKSLPRPAEGV